MTAGRPRPRIIDKPAQSVHSGYKFAVLTPWRRRPVLAPG
jgi:hypothetical protein